MPLSLEQYATYLDSRALHWPTAPEPVSARARPHLKQLHGVKAVLWNIYGTLLSISGGEVWFSHPEPFVMQVALEKTIQEFKMWLAMSRRPGQPGDYLGDLYENALLKQRMASGTGNEKLPEVSSELLWESLIKNLKKDYQWDVGFFGSLNEFARKVAYFFHRSLQGTTCYPGAADAMLTVRSRGFRQGFLADAQPFTTLQLQRGLAEQVPEIRLNDLLDDDLRFLSCDMRGRKPSERILRKLHTALREQGLEPEQVLHVGNSLTRDLAPARRLGMRTALYAGDKNSLQATPEQLKEPGSRPDVLLSDLSQIAEVIP
jgi:FMN phosphatase YigB (HAD superfamily)